jgi:hypothetical protein
MFQAEEHRRFWGSCFLVAEHTHGIAKKLNVTYSDGSLKDSFWEWVVVVVTCELSKWDLSTDGVAAVGSFSNELSIWQAEGTH